VARVTLPRLSLVLALVGGGLVLAGVLVGGDTSWIGGIEGAYFTRAAGTPAYSGVFDAIGEPQLLSLHDGNLWLGAGIALLLVGAAGMFAHAARLRLVRGTAD
jgi:hypothetical protein